MLRLMRTALGITTVCFVAFSSSYGQTWKEGAFTAKSSAKIPAFPKTLRGFRSSGKKDYWGESFETSGSLRVFGGQSWETIYDGPTEFPHTMNHCSDGVFMVRWRAAYPSVKVKSAVGYLTDNVTHTAPAASFGYMYGSSCEMPLFMFAKNNNELGDIYYEVKFWKAAP